MSNGLSLATKEMRIKVTTIPDVKQIRKICKPKPSHSPGLSPGDKEQICITGWKETKPQWGVIHRGNKIMNGLPWPRPGSEELCATSPSAKEAPLQSTIKLGSYLLKKGIQTARHSDSSRNSNRSLLLTKRLLGSHSPPSSLPHQKPLLCKKNQTADYDTFQTIGYFLTCQL